MAFPLMLSVLDKMDAMSPTNQLEPTLSMNPQKSKKKRIRNWTEQDRAVHREFEKSRREAFSERLTELTRLLPTLKVEQRPSKHIIVDASISYHRAQEDRHRQATHALQALVAERDDLLREVNGLRALCQPGISTPRQARPIDPGVLEMLADSQEMSTSLSGDSGNHDSMEDYSNISSQEAHTSLEVSHSARAPTATLPQGSPTHMVSSATAISNEIPHPPALSAATEAHPIPLPVHNLVESDFVGWGHPIPFDSNLINDTLPWTQPPDISTATPPKDTGVGYDTNVSHLVDDAALFWHQHPGILNTPPREDGLHFDSNSNIPDPSSILWGHQPGILSTTLSSNNHQIAAHETIQQPANSFVSNSENSSLSTRVVHNDRAIDPSASLC